MNVLEVKGQANASVILKGLLRQHGMPELTAEGTDALSAKFGAGVVIGNGVVSFDGKPLINALRAIFADADNRRFFVSDHKGEAQGASTLTERYRAEIAESRKKDDITDADLARYTGITRQHMEERRRAAQK
jgi:hypothetical protein